MTNSRECPHCGLERIVLIGYECRDGHLVSDSGGVTDCPHMERRRFLDSCQDAIGESGIPQPYLDKRFKGFDPGGNRTGLDIIKKWTKDPAGWVYIYGDIGTGKTHLACAAIYNIIVQGQKGLIVSVPELIWELQPSEKGAGATAKRLMRIEILALDDLGSHRDTPFVAETLFRILNRRYMAGRPTLITSNWTLKDMSENGLDWRRISDRILEMGRPDRIVKLEGSSRR